MCYNQPSYLGVSLKMEYLNNTLIPANFSGSMWYCSSKKQSILGCLLYKNSATAAAGEYESANSKLCVSQGRGVPRNGLFPIRTVKITLSQKELRDGRIKNKRFLFVLLLLDNSFLPLKDRTLSQR